MMEKLALLIITLYTPLPNERWKRLAVATALAGCNTFVAGVTQPLSDPLEVTIDFTSRYDPTAPAAVHPQSH